MKNGNVIDLNNYQAPHNDHDEQVDAAMNNELGNAINILIHRLRELGPIQNTN